MINQEEIYKLLQSENWTRLIDIFHKRKDLIKSDLLLRQALETALNVITQKALDFEKSVSFIDNLESLLMLKAGNFITLKEEQEEAITLAIINGKRENLPYCYQYAKSYPENEMCRDIIKEYEENLPREIDHSQHTNLVATENKKIVEQNDFRKSLFNSNQEVEFYLALKRVFDSYQVYPNVGLSSILNYDSLKEELNSKERDFFFKSSVDFVVLEPFRNYFPTYFFEIDSVWHDTEEQKERDKMKDKIFGLSGQKLYRIRKVDNSIDEREFEKLIIELREKIE
nr:DUF2726 domain-containing protein [uncultured Carboxylicivirga sp.]